MLESPGAGYSGAVALRSGKRLSDPSTCDYRSAPKRRKVGFSLDALPDDVMRMFVEHGGLSASDLANLGRVSKRLSALSRSPRRWRELYKHHFVRCTALTDRAADIAGGWLQLYASKAVTERVSAPWNTPSDYERTAYIEALGSGGGPTPAGIHCLFVVDGSGSVTEEDFRACNSFVKEAGIHLMGRGNNVKVGVLQFSNEVRVEVPLGGHSHPETFSAAVDSMTRMNGGTNISSPLRKTEEIFRSTEPSADHANIQRVVCMLTDGRVDAYQAREAKDRASLLCSMVPNVGIYALGVGRGVDENELMRIIGAAMRPHNAMTQEFTPCDRYLPLRTTEDLTY